MLYLSREDVAQTASMDDLIQVMEGAFREHGNGNVEMPLRNSLKSQDPKGSINVMPALLRSSKALGMKVVTHYAANPVKFGVPTINATILLLDFDTGAVSAMIDGTHLTAMRTAAVSGLATRYLAKESSGSVALLGSGVQAETHLEAMRCVRRVESAKVFSPTRAHREDFARRMSERFGMTVRAVGSSKEAVEGSDIVVTATPAEEPILEGDWLSEGSHVNAVGSGMPVFREVDERVLSRSRIVADDVDAAMSETGDFITPMKEGKFSKEMVYGSLGELVTGRKGGRTNDREITLFKSVGLALEDVAAAKFIYEKAKGQGRGVQI